MIIARIESLILDKGLDDALERAKAYIDAGADGILIHSRAKTPDDIFAFCAEYKNFSRRVPLFVVPTTYNSVTEDGSLKQVWTWSSTRTILFGQHIQQWSRQQRAF